MKQVLLVLTGIFLCLKAYSQTDFRQGFIINQKSDTIRGYIDYRSGKRSSKYSEFKKDLSGETVTYKPTDIKGYGFINDKYYESIAIKDKLQEETEVIFVEVLVKGTVSLYKDPNSFFVAKGDTTLHRLYVKEKSDYKKQSGSKLQYNRHIGLLNYMMQDCESKSIKEKIQFIELFEQPLTELVEEYNSCVSSSYVSYKSGKQWFTVKFGLAAGYRVSNLNFKSDVNSYALLTLGDYASQNGAVGAIIDMYSPRIHERISFQGGVFLCNPVYSASTQETQGKIVYSNNVTFTIKELKIPFGVQYKFPEKKYAPFIITGISNTENLQPEILIIQVVKINNETKSYQFDDFPFKRRQFGIWAGLGAERTISDKLKGYAEIRFERTNGIIDDPGSFGDDVTSHINNINFKLGLKY